mgnify:CR=1 FL=1
MPSSLISKNISLPKEFSIFGAGSWEMTQELQHHGYQFTLMEPMNDGYLKDQLPGAAKYFKTWWHKDNPTHLSFFYNWNRTFHVIVDLWDYTIGIYADKLFVVRRSNEIEVGRTVRYDGG